MKYIRKETNGHAIFIKKQFYVDKNKLSID